MQTDPNFANYRYDPTSKRIILLDFGATRPISPGIADQYRRLLSAGMKDDADQLHDMAAEIGFFDHETLPAHRTQIVDVMRTVFAALVADTLFDFSDNALSRDMPRKPPLADMPDARPCYNCHAPFPHGSAFSCNARAPSSWSSDR